LLANVTKATMGVEEVVEAIVVEIGVATAAMEVVDLATLVAVAERSATSATDLVISHENAVRLIAATNVMALDTSPEIALEHQMNPCAITAVNLGTLHGIVLRDVGKARPATTVANRGT